MASEVRKVAPFNRSFRVQLIIWTMVILATVVVALTSLIARNASRLLESQTVAQLSQLTTQSARSVEDFMLARQATVELWSADSLMLSVVRDPGLRAVFATSLTRYLGRYAQQEPWIANVLLIENSEVIFAVSGDLGQFSESIAASNLLDAEPGSLQLIDLGGDAGPFGAITRHTVDRGQVMDGIFVVLLLDLQVVQAHLLADASPSPNGFVTLQGPDGTILVDTPIPPPPMPATSGYVERIPDDDYLIERHSVAGGPLTVIGLAARSDIEAPVRAFVYAAVLLGLGAIVIGTLGTVYFTGRVTAPIRRLNKDAKKMANLRLGSRTTQSSYEVALPNSLLAAKEGYSQDEVGELAAVFELLDRTTDELTHANAQLESRNQDLDDARAKLRKNLDRLELEMNAARKLQLSMVARDGDVRRFEAGVEAVGLMEPAREVGGDFYDIFNIDDHMVCFFIGDVSDKGTPSALLMSRTVSLVRFATLQLARLTGDIPTPSDILEQVNEELCKNNSTRMFVTLFLGIFDTRTGQLFCGNAGHVSPLVGAGKNTTILTEDLPNLPLGIKPGAEYTTFERRLYKGERLTLFTDGVTEAENATPEFFGTNRLLNVIKSQETASPDEIVQATRAAIETFVDGEEQFDDITMLVIGWEPMGEKVR